VRADRSTFSIAPPMIRSPALRLPCVVYWMYCPSTEGVPSKWWSRMFNCPTPSALIAVTMPFVWSVVGWIIVTERCVSRYHPVIVPHGYTSYYLNVMAGPQRAWHFHNDPAHAWMLANVK